MKDNNEILQEALFKKKTYSEKFKDEHAQYAAVSGKDIPTFQTNNGVLTVPDADELTKRLTGALGMMVGTNSIKSMANRATKSFPIIVSDDVSPETAVMIKTMLEEQYASYIELLVANQVINVTDFEHGSHDGNIAIQALDRLSSREFGTERIARDARDGNLSLDSIMKNNVPYQVMKSFTGNESVEFTSGNIILDSLMENALIINSEDEAYAFAALLENEVLDEAVTWPRTHSFLDSTGQRRILVYANNDDILRIAINLGLSPDGRTSNGSNIRNNIPALESFIRARYNEPKRVAITNIPTPNFENVGDINITSPQPASTEKGDINTQIPNYEPAQMPFGTYLSKRFSNELDVNKAQLPGRNNELDGRYNKYSQYFRFDNKTGNNTIAYDKLMSPKVMVDVESMDTALENSIGEILTHKNNFYLKDRFEKASYLLASNRIAGTEYLSYVTDRLGIPMSDKLRRDIVYKYRADKVVFKGFQMYDPKTGEILTDNDDIKKIRSNIATNQKAVLMNVKQAVALSGKDWGHIAIGTGVGTGVGGAGVGIAAAGLAAGTALNPWLWALLPIGAAVGGISTLIYKALTKKKEKVYQSQAIEGWERVESLIDEMDNQRMDVLEKGIKYSQQVDSMNQRVNSQDNNNYKEFIEFKKEDQNAFAKFSKQMTDTLKKVSVQESIVDLRGYSITNTPAREARNFETFLEFEKLLSEDDVLMEELNEARNRFIISQRIPTDASIVKTQKIKYNPKETSIIPTFGMKDVVAYGTVEYDKKAIKDRKFNEPLIMTIKFKERYADDKYSDNELSAVIGILGVITRVPSDEMKIILQANTEGITMKNFFAPEDGNNKKDTVADMIKAFTGSKYADKLPTSGKVWNDLEKVTQLAVANRLAGSNEGNISNAHIVFSQKEIDAVKQDTGIDYLKNAKLSQQLLKKYSASMLLVCNDSLQLVSSYSATNTISWDVAPYSAYMGKNQADQLATSIAQLTRNRM